MPQSTWACVPQLLSLHSRAHEPQLLSPRATTTEACAYSPCSATREATAVRSPRTAMKSSPLLAATRESLRAATKTQRSQK